MSWPSVSANEMAWINADAMREIDRQMVDVVGITLLQMMENAGRSLATVVHEQFGPASVVVLAGSGGNGGGGLVAARHLHNAGVGVQVMLTADRGRLSAAATHQLAIVEWLGVPVKVVDETTTLIADGEVVIDAMVGYSLQGPMAGRAALGADLISTGPGSAVVSLDVPSGLPADGGDIGPVVDADATVTLCLPKLGLAGRFEVGRLFVADISVPAQVVEAVTGGPAPPFHRGPILLVE